MKKSPLGIAAALCAAVLLAASPAMAKRFIHHGEIEILFPKDDNLGRAVSEEIGRAKREALVFFFSFTHKGIADALIEMHRRGAAVRVLADAKQQRIKTSRHNDLRAAGIEIINGPKRRSWHNKVIVLDGKTVITGSANFTHAAQYQNRENLVIIRDNRQIADYYRDYWQRLADSAPPQ